MTFDVRLFVIALAAFAAASLAASAATSMVWSRRLPDAPARRAAALVRFRLLPTLIAAAALLLASASFIQFEPRTQESAGIILVLLAAGAVVLVGTAVVRVLRLHLATRRARRTWLASGDRITFENLSIPAYAIDAAFPIVAVVGVFRPVLVIARSVLEACSPDQLRAILAHERGHVTHHDNAKRAIFASVPDLLMWLPVSRRLASAWHEATEEAADNEAGGLGPQGRLHLAEALIRVARLAPGGPQAAELPASALYRGEDIQRRVCRLLAAPIAVARDPFATLRHTLLTIGVVATSAIALQAVHDLVEAAVTFLP